MLNKGGSICKKLHIFLLILFLIHTNTRSYSKMLSIASAYCRPRQCFFSTSCRPRLWLQVRNSAGGSEEKDESTQFEIDPETAREALKKLDQQFQSLSQKTQPSVKSEEEKNKKKKSNPLLTSSDPSYIDSDVGMRRKIGREQDMPELSGSFLGYSAAILLAITFLTNILFIVFVKPAFDG